MSSTNYLNIGLDRTSIQKYTREWIRKTLVIPSEYFVKRGFSSEILTRLDVGEYNRIDRSSVPQYDDNGEFAVGFTARSHQEKCPKCELYHKPNIACPTDEETYVKWRSSMGFSKSKYLYNFHVAKKAVTDVKKIILCESPGDVWRLNENDIEYAVGIYGVTLSESQELLLSRFGLHYIYLLFNNDQAGLKATQEIYQRLKRRFNVRVISFNKYNDLGEMPNNYIKDNIIREIEK